MSDNDSEKSEEPTGRRLSQAREEGNIAKSKELPTAFIFIAIAGFMYYYAPNVLEQIQEIMRELFLIGKTEVDVHFTIQLLYFLVISMTKLLLPITGLLLVVSMVANIAQVGFVYTPKALKPKLDSLNPIKGFGKLFSKKSLVELLKSLFKIFVIGFVAYLIVKGKIPTILALIDADPMDSIHFFGLLIYELFMKIGVLVLILSLIDYMYQKWQTNQDLKMTKQEVKEENKQMEGDPLVKQRIRSMQREMARKRMMENVPQADVVVTNPTHYAVALRYSLGKDSAPVVVAKGQRLVALRIREIAMKNRILVHREPPLARALFKTVDIGEEIPENLYKAVAEILAMVDKFKRQTGR